MAPRVSFLARLRGMDAYPKTIEEFKVHTMQGGLFSLLAFGFIVILLMSELSYYFTVDTRDKMMVDGTRNRQVMINFDIEFPRMPCELLAVESSDMAGAIQHDIGHNIKKTSIDANGVPIKEVQVEKMGETLNQTDATEGPQCGSCYSAGEPGECCNTCDDVRKVYERRGWMMPSLHTIAQCQDSDFEKLLRGELNQGCRIRGFLTVSKVAGKFYFAPSRNFKFGYLSENDLLDSTFKVFDSSHTIHSLAFGDLYPDMKNPLDNRQKNLEADKRGTFQYFIKVVPTEYVFLNGNRIDTNQFSVTEHFLAMTPLSEKGFPKISFSYSFSPIMFRIEQFRGSFLQFLISVSAIVGGVFTVMGIMDSATFAFLNRVSKAPLAT